MTVLHTKVEHGSGFGLEAAARRARFSALQGALGEGEIVALAHHRDDQAETVLLKLLRGAGPEGLGAMRKLAPPRRVRRLATAAGRFALAIAQLCRCAKSEVDQ